MRKIYTFIKITHSLRKMFAEYFPIIKKFKKIALHLKSLLYCTHIHAHKHRRRDLGETTRQSHKSQKTAQNFSRKNRFLHFCFRCFAIRKKTVVRRRRLLHSPTPRPSLRLAAKTRARFSSANALLLQKITLGYTKRHAVSVLPCCRALRARV